MPAGAFAVGQANSKLASPGGERHVSRMVQRPERATCVPAAAARKPASDSEPKKIFVFGLGYTGLAIASYLRSTGGW